MQFIIIIFSHHGLQNMKNLFFG